MNTHHQLDFIDFETISFRSFPTWSDPLGFSRSRKQAFGAFRISSDPFGFYKFANNWFLETSKPRQIHLDFTDSWLPWAAGLASSKCLQFWKDIRRVISSTLQSFSHLGLMTLPRTGDRWGLSSTIIQNPRWCNSIRSYLYHLRGMGALQLISEFVKKKHSEFGSDHPLAKTSQKLQPLLVWILVTISIYSHRY